MAAHVKDALLAKFAVALDEHLSQAVVTPETSLVPANAAAAGKPRGVTRHRRTRRWEAHIWYSKKQVYLGGYDLRDQASRAHDVMALKTRGTGCQLNFDEAAYSGLMALLPSVTVDQVVEALRHQSKGHITALINPEQPLGFSRSGKRDSLGSKAGAGFSASTGGRDSAAGAKRIREGPSDSKRTRTRSTMVEDVSRSEQPCEQRASPHAQTSAESLLTAFQPDLATAPNHLASYDQGLEQVQRWHQALQSPPGGLPAALPGPDSLDALSGVSAAAASVQHQGWQTAAQQQFAEWSDCTDGSLQGAGPQQGASSCLSSSIGAPTSAMLFQDGALPVAVAFGFAAAGSVEGVEAQRSAHSWGPPVAAALLRHLGGSPQLDVPQLSAPALLLPNPPRGGNPCSTPYALSLNRPPQPPGSLTAECFLGSCCQDQPLEPSAPCPSICVNPRQPSHSVPAQPAPPAQQACDPCCMSHSLGWGDLQSSRTGSQSSATSSSILSAAHGDMACELFDIPWLPPRAFAIAPGLSAASTNGMQHC